MKKLHILALPLIMLSISALQAYDDESAIETSGEYNPIEPRPRKSRETCTNCPQANGEVVDCRACCSEGRWVGECARQCGGCDMYNDQAAQEFRDYP